ncbi:hypothetical protein JCM3765_003104 [Sporobolomyces pararoseus]
MFEIDAGPAANTTFALSCILVVVLVFVYKLRPPPPQLHPFLLGRQSQASLTRFEDESPVYSNPNKATTSYLRPDKAVRSLEDILEGSLTCLEGGQRGSWVKGGEKITELVKHIRAGLLSKLGKGSGKVVVAVEDPTDALLVTLALASSTLKPIVIAPGSSIPDESDIVGIVHSTTRFVSARGVSANPDAVLVVLGDEDGTAEDILATGKSIVSGEGEEAQESTRAEPSDLALILISQGIPLEFSHVSLTASLVSWLSMFPSSPLPAKPTIKDTIYTFHHPSTPYGLGLALLAISTSASLYFPQLSTEPSSEEIESLFATRSAPAATLIFAPSSTLATPLYTLTLKKMIGDSSFIIRQARNGKIRLLREGSVSKSTIWDTILFKGLRKELGLHMLRGVFFSGPLEQGKLETFRCTFGTPAVSTLSHPFLLAPLSHGHFYDYQRLPPPGVFRLTGKEKAHVGPPSAGVEIKLRGSEEEIEKGRIRGEIFIRSPVLPRPQTLPSSLIYTDDILPTLPPVPGSKEEEELGKNLSQWLRTGIKAEISTEGVLWLNEQ